MGRYRETSSPDGSNRQTLIGIATRALRVEAQARSAMNGVGARRVDPGAQGHQSLGEDRRRSSDCLICFIAHDLVGRQHISNSRLGMSILSGDMLDVETEHQGGHAEPVTYTRNMCTITLIEKQRHRGLQDQGGRPVGTEVPDAPR